jgi:hypothetical protein
MPNGFSTSLIRAMTNHFLMYCKQRKNPSRGLNRRRSKVNHAINKLPIKAQVFLRESKEDFRLSEGTSSADALSA